MQKACLLCYSIHRRNLCDYHIVWRLKMHLLDKKEYHYQLYLYLNLKLRISLILHFLLLKRPTLNFRLLIGLMKHILSHLSLLVNRSFHHSPKTPPKASWHQMKTKRRPCMVSFNQLFIYCCNFLHTIQRDHQHNCSQLVGPS